MSPDSYALISRTFDKDRLRQAREFAMLTKQALAGAIGVSAAAVSQYESGSSSPRPDLIPALAKCLNVRPEFFTSGRPQMQLPVNEAFFRSLRATTAKQRLKATSYTEQLWELVEAVETHVQLPDVGLPGFAGGEITPGSLPADPVAAAQALRRAWQLGHGPVSHVVRLLESKGIIVVIAPESTDEVARIDAFSTLCFARPLVILSLDRADDIYRYRFTAAHELGHLVLHGGALGGDTVIEREADRFAAEFLTPNLSIRPLLPARVDFRRLLDLNAEWGISVQSLIYRGREVGLYSEATARRAYIRLNQLRSQGLIPSHPVSNYPGEVPSMLRQAVELADANGVSTSALAKQLAWKHAHLCQMLGVTDRRPLLEIVPK
ncbi:MAG: XRE family transcriptional regulator [Promicromonosporaceae bacterium]|nr:XRE family transcriptional regulator [Promicromonosporaceae bacterium]